MVDARTIYRSVSASARLPLLREDRELRQLWRSLEKPPSAARVAPGHAHGQLVSTTDIPLTLSDVLKITAAVELWANGADLCPCRYLA